VGTPKEKRPRKPSYWDMRTKALMHLAGSNRLHSSLTRVLTYLIWSDNKANKVVWPSQATIATATHLGVRTVKRALAIGEAVGAIGTMYRTRSEALANGIPVCKTGNHNLDVIKVYYDWDGYHGKLTPDMVDAINAAMTDNASLLPGLASERGHRGLVNGATVAWLTGPPWPTNPPSSKEVKVNPGCARRVEPGGASAPPTAGASPASRRAPLIKPSKNWQESYLDPDEDQ
jgi:helix-turn-helix protein